MNQPEAKLVKPLEDFVLDPKRHLEAFELIQELANEPCRGGRYTTILAAELWAGTGCTACITCRARVLVDPEIRQRWMLQSVGRWNAMTGNNPNGHKCDVKSCPELPARFFKLRDRTDVQVNTCMKHATTMPKIEIKKLLLARAAAADKAKR